MRIKKVALYLAVIPVGFVAIFLIGLFSIDLGRFKPQVESLVTGLLQREFRIDGPLQVTLDLQKGAELQAADVHLAATDWSAQPDLVSLDVLELRVDLWSVFRSGPIVINQLSSEGLRVHLEESDEGVGNWVLFPDTEEPEPEIPAQRFELPVLPEHVQLLDSTVTFDTRQRKTPLRLDLSKIEELVTPDRQVSLAADGSIGGETVELRLSFERVDELITLRDVDLAMSGRLGEVKLTGKFSVTDLLHPRRPTASLNISGPSSEYLLNLVQLEKITSGPLDLRFKLAPGQGPMQLELTGQFGEFTSTINGQFDDFSLLQEYALQVEAQGPDLGRLADILGVPDVPNDHFTLNGDIHRDGAGLAINGVTLAVEQSQLLLDASLPGFPALAGAHATARLDMPDISRFSPMLGLPGELSGPLDVGLDLTPLTSTQGAALLATATNSGLTLKARGNLLGAGKLVGSDLQIDLSGPGLDPITRALALQSGPQIPFELKAGLRRLQQGYEVSSAQLSMGDNQVSLQGMVGNAPLDNDTDISLEFRGENLSRLLAAIGAGPNEMPQEPYHLSVELKSAAGQIVVPEWTTTIGAAQEYRVVASAHFDPARAPLGAELKLKAHGPDISKLLHAAGMGDAPVADFEIDADIEGVKSGYRVNWLRGRLAKERVSVKGNVGEDLFSGDTQLQFETSSPALKHALASYGVNLSQLPEGEFKATGRVNGSGTSVELKQIVANFAGASATLDGDLGELTDLDGTSLKLAVSGPNFRSLLPPQTEFSGLFKPFSLSADLGVREKKITIDSGKFKLDRSRINLDGKFGMEPLMRVGSFQLVLESPDLAPLLEKNGVATGREALPVDLRFSGGWKDELWTIQQLDLKSGEGRLSGSGTLVGPPNIGDSNLQLQGRFLNLANFNPLLPLELPALPASIKLHLLGDGNTLNFETLDLSVGESSLSGTMTITDGDTPRIVGALHSSLLDLPSLLPVSENEQSEAQQPAPDVESNTGRPGLIVPDKNKNRKVIPDTPLPMDALQRFTADISVKVDELYLSNQAPPYRNAGLDLTVKNGGLVVRRFGFDGTRNGKVEGLMGLKPAPDGPTLTGRLSGEKVTIGLPESIDEELDNMPLLDIKIAFAAQGDTVRSMAAGLNGYLRVEMGRGRIRAGATQVFTNDFFALLLDTLNPFSEKDPYTKVRCGMALATIEHGQVTGKPALVFRTDRLDITADTQINLVTEDLQATFTTTPRKGLGFSLSSLVNPYVMVIGTLGNPLLSIDPEGVLVQGGAAVATGGLSILAKGLKDRFFSDKDPCGTAGLEADKDQQALEKKYADDPIIN